MADGSGPSDGRGDRRNRARCQRGQTKAARRKEEDEVSEDGKKSKGVSRC